ncbi:enoyl-CoA hydratase-related protein [Pseudogemmobacter faecipullorum]|uniref:Enoyl-CoA hydratase/isomerase family protein n=1 Tax=Pseudogemmobacter faecipullorum TaxID=2755041 RepID=A0ABS8CMZ6_9RHOB|nr:enoyl-CoA hydratase-related protein [Pseudogemmobacter faecipullorum]MCB5410776.1 enoyl-CoA hydratase/isomerase family protein [Pseudogemmobacter faecipullorum]
MESTDKDLVTIEDQGAVVLLRLNRPEVLNALNMPLRRRLAEIFEGFTDGGTLRAVVLTGDEKSFAAGADIADMAAIGTVDMYLRHNERLWEAVARCPVPVIAAVNGFALGGGMELAMHADIIIAGKSARFGQPEVKVGIMPGAGGTQRLLRAVGKFKAMRLCLTGEMIGADEACAMGLVSQVVEDDQVLAEAMAFAGRISRMPAIAVNQIKEVILHGQDAPLGAAMALERKALQILFSTEDKNEGMAAFLEKRRPDYTGR